MGCTLSSPSPIRKAEVLSIPNLYEGSCTPLAISIFMMLNSREYKEEFEIHSSIYNYCAYQGAQRFPGLRYLNTNDLFHISQGIKMSRPVNIGAQLPCGCDPHLSISHKGILAIYLGSCKKKVVQLTNLLTGEQTNVDVENETLVGFYDDSLVMLTEDRPLKVSTVRKVVEEKNTLRMEVVVNAFVSCDAYVAPLNQTRTLQYHVTSGTPYEYNVDTKANKAMEIRDVISRFVSLTGVNVGVKGMFQCGSSGNPLLSLSENNMVSTVWLSGKRHGFVSALIPSSSDPLDLTKAAKLYSHGGFTVAEHRLSHFKKIKCNGFHSIVRVYKDVFLVCNKKNSELVLVRIWVP